jgi:hypothetical protein
MTLKDQKPSKKHQVRSIEVDVMLLSTNKSVVRPQLKIVTNLTTGMVSPIANITGARYEH